ncbi:MAG: SET domain-containing protein-lysine N-methyltransferase [Gammaproteobacteria bacterium]|nr:SET domain-containing protein-lysine N-methyltransferase [Gammaproteobacteria bacterium]
MTTGFELRETSGKGEGIFATKSFKVGDIVMTGVIEKMLNGNHSHASQVGENEYALHAGLIIKVNHSCGPNCGISINVTGAHDFVAMNDISVNEEITFDYAMRNYKIDYFPVKCMCGSIKCRDKVTGWQGLSSEKKREYEGFVALYLLEIDKAGYSQDIK